ncbi:hypothetical protein V8G54_025115 [Vigna mungo]|uniref:Uncharacterized protein n=1 Tax=Vigna mungo TaxID=3915 RepID=A0AAQ3RTT4_VIGMU
MQRNELMTDDDDRRKPKILRWVMIEDELMTQQRNSLGAMLRKDGIEVYKSPSRRLNFTLLAATYKMRCSGISSTKALQFHSKPTGMNKAESGNRLSETDFSALLSQLKGLQNKNSKLEEENRKINFKDELQQVREKYVCDWILDIDNVRRDEVLRHLGML